MSPCPTTALSLGNRPFLTTTLPYFVIPSVAERLRFYGHFLDMFFARNGEPISQQNSLGDRLSREGVYFCACSNRLLTSSQFTVFHQAAR
jgi:hypothetical protein